MPKGIRVVISLLGAGVLFLLTQQDFGGLFFNWGAAVCGLLLLAAAIWPNHILWSITAIGTPAFGILLAVYNGWWVAAGVMGVISLICLFIVARFAGR